MLQLVQDRKFYPELCRWAGIDGLTYAEQKRRVFAGWLFADKYPNAALVAALEREAPMMAAYRTRARSIAHNRLALDLQTLEADIMISGVVPRLRAVGIESCSIHDGVLVQADRVDAARTIIAHEFARVTGIMPMLHFHGAIEAQRPDIQMNVGIAGVIIEPASATASLAPTFTPCLPPSSRGSVACPADYCPDCWAQRIVVPLESYFGCDHRPPRPKLWSVSTG